MSAKGRWSMIVITEERLVPLRDAPKYLPVRPSGRRLHISAVYRWAKRGVRGVRLETATVGGTTYTSHEALQRFAEALTSPSTKGAVSSGGTRASRTTQVLTDLEKRLGLDAGELGR